MLACNWLVSPEDRSTQLQAPLADGTIPDSPLRRRPNAEHSPNTSNKDGERSLAEGSLREGSLKEGTGKNEPPSKSEPQPPKDSDLLVERILKTHPSSWTKDGVIPEFPHAWKAAVIDAIERSGAEAVERGVKAYAAAVKRWPANERKFVKSPDKFFGSECHYLKDPAEWESENAVIPKPCQMPNPADIRQAPGELLCRLSRLNRQHRCAVALPG